MIRLLLLLVVGGAAVLRYDLYRHDRETDRVRAQLARPTDEGVFEAKD